MNTAPKTVLLDISGHIATITLNAPERHNSLGAVEIHLLIDYFERLSMDPKVRVLLLTGAGSRTFCSGAALDQLSSGAITPEKFSEMTSRLRNLRIPTLAALNGGVYGGACELALSCDFRMGCNGMRAFIPASKFGLFYPVSGIEVLVAVLGLANAQRFLLAAEQFSAEQLLSMGFVQALHEDADALMLAANDYVADLAKRGPIAVQAMKAVSQKLALQEADKEWAAALVKQCNDSTDLAEGMKAAKEKREPVFHGV